MMRLVDVTDLKFLGCWFNSSNESILRKYNLKNKIIFFFDIGILNTLPHINLLFFT